MVNFNLLTESFITNQAITSQRELTALDMEALIAQSGNVLTYSGSNVSFLIDLGVQRDIDRLRYTFTPLSLSGLEITYGRSLDQLVIASPNLVGDSVEVIPAISGYSYPRYFTITHSATLPTPITLSGLTVLNNDSEVDFGATGTQESLTITAIDGFQGYSNVQELKVFNDSALPANMYVSVDPSITSLETIQRLELSATPTGVFEAFNSALAMPNSIPFEWGDFTLNTKVTSSGYLRLEDPSLTLRNFTVGVPIQLTNGEAGPTNARLIEARDYLNQEVAVTYNNNLRFLFINPRTGTTFTSVDPPIIPTTSAERDGHLPAWDRGGRLYYMLNNIDQTVRYYDIDNNSHHVLTTLTSGYARATRLLVCDGDDLYIAGLSSTSGTESTAGVEFTKINTTTLVQTTLFGLPATPVATTAFLAHHDGYIYYIPAGTGTTWYRYSINLNGWESLTNIPSGNDVHGLVGSRERQKVIIFKGGTISAGVFGNTYEYSPLVGTFSSSILSGYHPGGGGTVVPRATTLLAQSSLIVSKGDFNVRFVTALSEVPDPILPTTFSGSWVSPVFRLQDSTNFHRMLLDYDKTALGYLKFDSSIGVDNFEIRGSNEPPSSDSFIENFDTPLDPEGFVTQTLDENSVVVTSGGYLVFNHDYLDNTLTPFNRGLLYLSLPFNSSGKMQYKFWWNPANSKAVGAENFSAFYLVPFLNTIDTGAIPDRNSSTLRRTANDYIYLKFGQTSDTGGSYTRIGVYNGSSVVEHTISAFTGEFYEVTFLLDWTTGDYSLLFQGALVGTGSIPLTQLIKLQNQHSFEFYSTSDSADSTEKFRYLTINRIGNTPTFEGVGAVPLHLEDPLYGRNGSLDWYPVTVNSPLIPKYDYVQVKITFRSNGLLRSPTLRGIQFPKVLKLENVPASGTESIYVRYNFPDFSTTTTDTAYLKAWMSTDKV